MMCWHKLQMYIYVWYVKMQIYVYMQSLKIKLWLKPDAETWKMKGRKWQES